MATTTDSRGAEGGRPTLDGGVPVKWLDQGGRLNFHLPNAGYVYIISDSRGGVVELEVVI